MFVMNFFDHKDLGNHLLQLYPKVVKHPVFLLILSVFYFSEIFVNVIAVKSSDISYKKVFILLQLSYQKIIIDGKGANR